ncbi:MAG: MarR family transcriptional regulator [Acholeplasmatales bacterium]|jgi:DNA-binding MarR family transcriptional regulator|nr:MarR family transcriptional regulator [Acholeplasmatales bacterium]
MLNDLPLVLMTKIYKNYLKKQSLLHNEYGLTEQQVVFLMIIFKNDRVIRMTDITEQLGIDKSNTTRTIKQLENKGYIIKDLSHNQRKYPISLSLAGQKLMQQIYEIQMAEKGWIFSSFTETEIAVIEKFILKIIGD